MSHLTDQYKKPQASLRVEGQMLDDVVRASLSRRTVLKGGLGASLLAVFGVAGLTGCDDDNGAGSADYSLKFGSVAENTSDTVTVPQGYTVDVLYSAGDALLPGAIAYGGTPQSSAETELQSGGNHDGMHFFELPGVDPNKGGLLAINHENYDGTIMLTGVEEPGTAEEKRLALSAVGVSIVEVQLGANGKWQVKKNSPYNKRYTGNTLYRVSGPAAAAVGGTVVGTLNNCSSGATPWGTYLTCEETTENYFDPSQPEEGYGWVVEIDPYGELAGLPVKRTALGRFDHENAAYLLGGDNSVAIYLGDDGTPGCIYKFVPSAKFKPNDRAANGNLLDEGTLYAAKFKADGSGEWIALVQGQNGLVAGASDPGNTTQGSQTPTTIDFNTQADVLINTKAAARVAGATLMDRPEWITVGPDKTIYVTLTNNSGRQVTDEANPRKQNRHGHILRWKEDGDAPTAIGFEWEIFLLAGDPELATEAGNLVGDISGDTFSSPDGIRVDPQNRLWVQTDMSVPGSSGVSGKSNVDVFGHNAMYAFDQQTRESKRFLVGPVGCEITGIAYTPDLKTFFINIQHPTGEWPSADLPARSSTIVVRRSDGQPVGA